MLRRNVEMVYIIENNGVYGLTKGQFSATADIGQKLKYAGKNELPPIDLCLEAIASGAGFVARSFAGDPKQVQQLLKAALSSQGTAVLDIISPCVTFNNSRSLDQGLQLGQGTRRGAARSALRHARRRDHGGVWRRRSEGRGHARWLADPLKKLDIDYEPTDKYAAMRLLEEARDNQQFITGLIYFNEARPNLVEQQRLVDTPLVQLPPEKLRPSREALDKINASFM